MVCHIFDLSYSNLITEVDHFFCGIMPFAANYYLTLFKYVGSGYPKEAEPPCRPVL